MTALRNAIRGDGKDVSSSRLIMVWIVLLILVLWVGVGILIAFMDDAWDRYDGWMEWGKQFAMVAVAPYVLGRFAGAVGTRTNGVENG
jgi:hypothetical protein